MGTVFNPQPDLAGDLLRLRPLEQNDLEDLYAAASAPEVWAQHPAHDRHLRDRFMPYAHTLLDSGTTLVVIDRPTGRIIGCSRYYVSPDQPESISIGFTFLNHSFWGGVTNFEMKRLMLDHAFQSFDEVWFHIASTNIRSQKAIAKIGAEYVYDAVLDLLGGPASRMCYRLTRSAWEQRRRRAGEKS